MVLLLTRGLLSLPTELLKMKAFLSHCLTKPFAFQGSLGWWWLFYVDLPARLRCQHSRVQSAVGRGGPSREGTRVRDIPPARCTVRCRRALRGWCPEPKPRLQAWGLESAIFPTPAPTPSHPSFSFSFLWLSEWTVPATQLSRSGIPGVSLTPSSSPSLPEE